MKNRFKSYDNIYLPLNNTRIMIFRSRSRSPRRSRRSPSYGERKRSPRRSPSYGRKASRYTQCWGSGEKFGSSPYIYLCSVKGVEQRREVVVCAGLQSTLTNLQDAPDIRHSLSRYIQWWGSGSGKFWPPARRMWIRSFLRGVPGSGKPLEELTDCPDIRPFHFVKCTNLMNFGLDDSTQFIFSWFGILGCFPGPGAFLDSSWLWIWAKPEPKPKWFHLSPTNLFARN